jgi:hypothetical protein
MEDLRSVARMMLALDSGWFDDLWLWYWANGGNADKFDFDAYLHGFHELDPFDTKILAWALEDMSSRY